mmetsp:Transcript_43334/g.91006  ORF Transcript_43334/g.91006 Transcript_43334/m.91006 type:complete len:267 (+) Transcript_43334:180-980(+)
MTSTTLFTLLLLTFLTTFLIAAATDDGDIPPHYANKTCPDFRCSSLGQSPVQKAQSNFTSTGCDGMLNLVGGYERGSEKYAVCCDRLNACIQICGAPKQVCDDSYKSCSDEICLGDDDCKDKAGMNFMFMGFEGCELYDDEQENACECVPENKLEEKRMSVLQSFYKKYAPDSLDEVDRLAKEADTNVKLSALFRKLHKEYPESIKVMLDDTSAQMKKNTEDNVKKDDVMEDVEEEETIEDVTEDAEAMKEDLEQEEIVVGEKDEL